MKAKKIAGILLSIVTVLVIVLLCVFLFWLGPTVKLVAEKVGSKALGTPLTIKELSINPRHGTFHMTGFSIANHAEFGRTNTVTLANMDIAIDMGSIFSPTVIVHKVQIGSPYFVYEQNVASDNIAEYIRNIEEYLGIDPNNRKEVDPVEAETASEEEEAKVVIVEQLEINDIRFYLANTDDPQLDINIGIEQLAVSMTNGSVTLKNIHVSNPGLLETPHLFTLDSIRIDLDPASIYSDTVSIRDIQVIRPYAYLEHNPQTDTVAEFMKIAATFADTRTNAPVEPTAVTTEAEPEESADGPPPVALHNLLVDDIQIKLLDTTVTNASSEPRMLAGIGSITVRLVDGTIQIKGITVPNPEGFVSSNLFHLANIDITLEPDSIFSTQTVIQEIFVNSPTIYLEQTETSGNASELKDTLMGFVPPVPETKGAPTPKEPSITGEGPKPIPLSEQAVVLQTLIVTNFTINLSLPADTNAPASGSLHLPTLEGTRDRVSSSKLNPLHQTDSKATNGTPAVVSSADGPLKLIAFKDLVAKPLDGTVRISNLEVANPKGFANEHLVTLEQFRIDLDPDSLQSDTLLIRDILIDKPRIAYERKITTDNIKALQTEIEKAVARRREYTETEKAPEKAESAGGEAAGQKVIIEHLLVQGGLVKAKISALPSAPVPLPNIEMKDMGKAEGGTSIGEALSNIGGTLYDTIIGSVASVTGFAGDALKGAGALTLGTLGNVTGLTSGKSEPMAGEEGKLAEGEAAGEAPQTAEPAKEKKPRRGLFHRGSGRFF